MKNNAFCCISENKINAGPKIFAARIGLVLSSLVILTFILNVNWLAFVLTGILGLFSFLEGTLGLCIACVIYPFVYKLFYKGKFQGIII